MPIENEIKFKISAPKPSFKKKIAALGFQYQKEVFQEDHYFSPPHKNFFGTKKYYLRLRKKADGTAVLAYHVVINNLQTRELEVVSDSFKNLENILKHLDFKTDCIVKKHRQVFINERQHLELVLDKVAGLGYFMEIEYLGKWSRTASDNFQAVIKQLGLKKQQIVAGCGYPDLLAGKAKKYAKN